MFGQGFFAGMQFVTERALVLLRLKRSVTVMLLLVNSQIGLGRVALKADVTLERFLSSVHSGVTFILS